MKHIPYRIILLLALFQFSCTSSEKQKQDSSPEKEMNKQAERSINPASDAKAVEIAEKVLLAHGGEEAWNNTRYISWNFLDSRDLTWDKYTGNVKIVFPRENSEYRINVNSNTGNVMLNGKLIQDEDSLKKYVERGRKIWVNDAYWLVFPFKFLDPGVKLEYAGRDTTKAGQVAEVIAITFDEVGYTPENKYLAFVDPNSSLILQWDYFANKSDSIPGISQLWSDYGQYGEIMLSAGRGERDLAPIQVLQEMDSLAFQF